MQKAQNELREIIWEITDNCGENCSYCGSKDHINKTLISHEHIINIADKINTFPPKEVNISGGNPLLVPIDTHEEVIRILKNAGVNCKIIVNPFNIKTVEQHNILELYDWIGVSINTYDELQRAKSILSDLLFKTTIITNFNTENIFLFKFIDDFTKENKLTWQIQYTMYKDKDPRAIYNNDDALAFLKDKIEKSPQVITADNMNQGTLCFAGRHSLGILANGEVIPCLSMRAWEKDIVPIGDLTTQSLYEIWVYGFAEMRCSSFKCCKDHCKTDQPEQDWNLTTNTKNDYITWITTPEKYPNDIVMLYGVQPNQVVVYGVQPQSWTHSKSPLTEHMTFVYGVFNDKDIEK